MLERLDRAEVYDEGKEATALRYGFNRDERLYFLHNSGVALRGQDFRDFHGFSHKHLGEIMNACLEKMGKTDPNVRGRKDGADYGKQGRTGK